MLMARSNIGTGPITTSKRVRRYVSMAITECKEQHRIQDETRREKFETVKNGEIVAESMKQCILQGAVLP